MQPMTGVPGLSTQWVKITEQHLNLCLHITVVLFANVRLLFPKVIKIFRTGFVFFCFVFISVCACVVFFLSLLQSMNLILLI